MVLLNNSKLSEVAFSTAIVISSGGGIGETVEKLPIMLEFSFVVAAVKLEIGRPKLL